MVDSENIRDSTILREAMLAIDPVIYRGDLNQLKYLKGEELREVVIGATAPYYSGFGGWTNDTYNEYEERPVMDVLDATRYIEGTTVINGYFPNGAPTRDDLVSDAKATYNHYIAKRERVLKEKKMFGVGRSCLRTMFTHDDEECTIATSDAKWSLAADRSGLISEHMFSSLACDTTATIAATISEDIQIAVPQPVESAFDIDLSAHFGTGDWADDEEVGEIYLEHVESAAAVVSTKKHAIIPNTPAELNEG